jgi:hypothetical protein
MPGLSCSDKPLRMNRHRLNPDPTRPNLAFHPTGGATTAAELKRARDRLVGDALFYIQITSALGFGISQGVLMMTTTEGVSMTWLSFWGVFLLINLSLSIRAHQIQPSRITRQTVITYATWTTMMLFDTAIFLWQDSVIWSTVDTWTAAIAVTGIVVTLLVGYYNKLAISDPLVRGYLAVFFKGVPQLTLAYNILSVGGSGVSVFGILTGHITICSRLGQILMSLREAGWDRNRQGSAISEIANEASWIAVTIAWFIMH